jgi:hypothetical protein
LIKNKKLTLEQFANIISNQKWFFDRFSNNTAKIKLLDEDCQYVFNSEVTSKVQELSIGNTLMKWRILNTLKNWQKNQQQLSPELESFDIMIEYYNLSNNWLNTKVNTQLWSIKWKSICVTWTLNQPRADIEYLITQKWWYNTSKVNWSTDILVVADPNKKTSKLTDAQNLQKKWSRIKIISEKEFWDMVAQS